MNIRVARLVRLPMLILLMVLYLFGQSDVASKAYANGTIGNESEISAQVDQMYADLEKKDNKKAEEAFKAIKKWWTLNKAVVKSKSFDLALEIDKQIAALSLAMLTEDISKSLDSAASLRFSLHNYEDGAYVGDDGKSNMTLSAFVSKLLQAKQLADDRKWDEAGELIKRLQSQWLSVEGDVVSRSQKVYNNTERDLVMVDAYLTNEGQRSQASAVLARMADSLTPLVDAGYSWWDAALIPLREGLEAVLVVGALLVAAGRSGSKKAKRWVVGGASAGVIICLAAGFAVSILLSSAAFGGSNSLINGWTGVISSIILLYVSYWLHRNADIKKWNSFLGQQSHKASSTGRMISFGFLAFFAILREGLETVLFLIGMAGKMPAGTLAAGIAAGFGLLVVLAWLMLRAGSRLPVRPLFLVSSLVVFYLCFKFLGSGIHSLQMAGVIPPSVEDYLPEMAAISLYPSWYSTLPQLVFVLIGLAVVLPQFAKRIFSPTRTVS